MAAVALLPGLVAFATPAVAAPAAAPAGAGAQGATGLAGTTSVTFGFTNAPQGWTPPPWVTSATFIVKGAGGSDGGAVEDRAGEGASVTATLPVVPGQRVEIVVGGSNGYNGGGAGGTVGSNGGGATDVRMGTCAATLNCRRSAQVLVAAGGGGSGVSGKGGDGGAPAGQAGGDGDDGATGGGGGTRSAGGTGGIGGQASQPERLGGTAGTSGTRGQGGAGGQTFSGGGGGGYFGGGGGGGASHGPDGLPFGAAGGGGGGSSYADTSVATDVTFTTGGNAGNGSVRVIYAVASTAVSAVSVSPAMPIAGSPVALSVTVSSGGSPILAGAGAVQFDVDGSPVGSPVAVGPGGVAALDVPSLPAGPHAVRAFFSSTAGYLPSQSPVSTVKVLAPSVVSVLSSASPSTAGQGVVFTATVSSGGLPVVSDGGVVFTVDGAQVGPQVPVGVHGTAVSRPVTALAVGSHSVVAVYSDGVAHAPSISRAITQTVQAGAPELLASSVSGVVVSPGSPVAGAPVSYSVVVSSQGSPVPSGAGAVTFAVDGVAVGSPVAVGDDGVATVPGPGLPAGAHVVTASFDGGSAYEPSSSAPVSFTVAGGAVAPCAAYAGGELFVCRAYEAIVRRAPDAGGLAYWSGQLADGVSPLGVALSLAHQPEANTRLLELLYEEALGRGPDAGGAAYWAPQLVPPGSAGAVLAGLFGAGEGLAHNGGSTASLVDAIYRAVLGRGADGAGGASWVSVMGSPGTVASRTAGALGLIGSEEAAGRAVSAAVTQVCGPGVSVTGLQAGQLAAAYQAGGENPLALAGRVLAEVCSPITTPPPAA